MISHYDRITPAIHDDDSGNKVRKKREHEQNIVHDDDYRTSSMDVRKRFKIHYTALILVWLREMKTHKKNIKMKCAAGTFFYHCVCYDDGYQRNNKREAN